MLDQVLGLCRHHRWADMFLTDIRVYPMLDRCDLCRRPRRRYGFNSQMGCCWQCCLETDIASCVLDTRACCRHDSHVGILVPTKDYGYCRHASWGLAHMVHHLSLFEFLLSFLFHSRVTLRRSIQTQMWTDTLRGKWIWNNFDCGYATEYPFDGLFGVNSWRLVGENGRPVHLQVLFGVSLGSYRVSDFPPNIERHHELTILDLVIEFLVPAWRMVLILEKLPHYIPHLVRLRRVQQELGWTTA